MNWMAVPELYYSCSTLGSLALPKSAFILVNGNSELLTSFCRNKKSNPTNKIGYLSTCSDRLDTTSVDCVSMIGCQDLRNLYLKHTPDAKPAQVQGNRDIPTGYLKRS